MSSAVVAAFEEAIGSLDAVDLDTLDDDALHDLTVATQRLRDRFELAAGRVLARWDTRGVWRNDQSLSAPARLSREVNSSLRSCRARLRQARRLGDVPGVVEAVGRGQLSVEYLELLGRAQRVAPEDYASDEAMLVTQCAGLRFQQAEQVVAYWRLHVDPDGVNADAAANADRATAHVSETLDGTIILNATLTGVDAETFHSELRRLTDEIRHVDRAAGVLRTAAQRRAAALVEMATRSASTPTGAQRPRPLFTVLLGEDTFRHFCETAAGRIVPPDTLAPFVDEAMLEVLLFDGPATVISVSKRRRFTGALRRAIQVRDRRCQHPAGCDIPADRCDVDHIEPWPQRTDQFNGRLECPGHNRLPHLHDTDTQPPPPRDIGFLDQLRALIRWRQRHYYPDDQAS
jgi:Domain of unknown function (DUF222)